MLKREFCYLYLTCEDGDEATKIVHVLLEKRLIVCAKQIPITADFHWQGKIRNSNEAMLIMESALDLFDEVEKVVAKLHSYETFVLEAVPIAKVSEKATAWMQQNLRTNQ